MMRISRHIRSFANGKVILQIQFVHAIIHPVYGFPHMICVAVSSNEVKLSNIELRTELINIFLSVQLKYVPRI